MSAQARGKAKEKPIASLIAGATAGGVEAFITFPLESIKTQLQFGALDGGKVGSLSLINLYLLSKPRLSSPADRNILPETSP